MRKDRHQKFFKDKFDISEKRSEREVNELIRDYFKKNKIEINHKTIKDVLVKLNLYQGVFYVQPEDVNHKLLNLNLEDVYQDLAKLKKQKHDDIYWAYDQDEFQKVYVLNYDGTHAIVAVTYNDSFCKLVVDTIRTNNIYLEGNMAKSILTNTCLENKKVD